MATFAPERLREVQTLDDVLELFGEELDWPVGDIDLEDAVFEWEPEELGIPAEQLPRVGSLRQLRPLTASQPWGIFFLELTGPRLPITPLRRLLRSLVTRKRATSGTRRTWHLDDLLFVTATDSGAAVELHLVAFFERADGAQPDIRSLPWSPEHSPRQHLSRLTWELLPHLEWPDDPQAVDDWRATWRQAFKLRHGAALRSAAQLAERMAETARELRVRISAALAEEDEDGAFTVLLEEIRGELVADVDDERFADMCAQTLVYGALTARVIDPVGFGASPVLTAVPLANPFLTSFFEQVHDEVAEMDLEAAGLEALVADLRETDVESILDQFGATAAGGDPVIHFYESFLAAYAPGIRAEVGAFYTPQPVVRCIVRTVDDALRLRLGLEDGIADEATWADVARRTGTNVPTSVDSADPFVSVLDPATGTGTFLVEWIRQARESFCATRPIAAWPEHLRTRIMPALRGLELMLAPYAIAHLKVALEVGSEIAQELPASVLLTDTLELPGPVARLEGLDPVAREGQRAAEFKRDGRPTVIVGNPPYRRVAREDAGGWVASAEGDRAALMQDVIDLANQRTIFSHVASLYNLYVYFWRWALWKSFEQPSHAPGVVAFITASSWLESPGFVGVREAVRSLCSEVWVIDLGGDAHGTHPEENVFDIRTPVAIAVLIRAEPTDDTRPARIHYRRLEGTRAEKLAAVALVRAPDLEPQTWTELPSEDGLLLKPAIGGETWTAMPLLRDLLPWQQPGCKLNRTWPVAPDRHTLDRRWAAFLADEDEERRAELFPDPPSGRTVGTKVGDLPTLASLTTDAAPRPAARYHWRAFDRQWTFEDPRLAGLERPALWQSRSEHQLFVATLASEALGAGPALHAFTSVPDLHVFNGRGGKDVLPLYRDAGAQQPNVPVGLLATIGSILREEDADLPDPSPEDLVAYIYALLSTPGYQARFEAELTDRDVRVPLTGDPALFDEAVAQGRELLWLHTFGERFRDDPTGRGEAMPAGALGWQRNPTRIPEDRRELVYDDVEWTLAIADGLLTGVAPEVWAYQVSGWPVVQRWLEHRTRKGRGRRSSELDLIRPQHWDPAWTHELLRLLRVLSRSVELHPIQDDLLSRITTGLLISAEDLPSPTDDERKVPRTLQSASRDTLGLT